MPETAAHPYILPPAMRSEAELRRFLGAMLGRNASCASTLSFLGGGCWQHDVPAVCEEIANRAGTDGRPRLGAGGRPPSREHTGPSG